MLNNNELLKEAIMRVATEVNKVKFDALYANDRLKFKEVLDYKKIPKFKHTGVTSDIEDIVASLYSFKTELDEFNYEITATVVVDISVHGEISNDIVKGLLGYICPDTIKLINNMVNLDMDNINIITHNTRYHCDEVTAIAMLKILHEKQDPDKNINIFRVPHYDSKDRIEEEVKKLDIRDYHYVVDTGGEYDRSVCFDHHQFKKGHPLGYDKISSAGMIYDYVYYKDSTFKSKAMTKLIKLIDNDDTGIKPAEPGELPHIITKFYDGGMDFESAVEFVKTYIESMIKDNVKRDEYITIIDAASYVEGTNVKIIDEDIIPGWDKIIDSNDIPNVDIVVTLKGEIDTYVAKLVRKDVESYDAVTYPMVNDELIDFVHSTGFISKSSGRENMVEYIKKYFSKK